MGSKFQREDFLMSKVSDVLNEKGNAVLAMESSSTVFEAIKVIADAKIGALLVKDGENVVGVFSERDFLVRCGVAGLDPKKVKIKDVMTSKIICADPEMSVEECLAIMSEKQIRHLPVMKGKNLVGIISIIDLVKWVSKNQEVHIQYLTDYISGKYPA